MPKIDPYTLIKTLGLLLSPKGGIRSSEEVTRIVQLMQKFSKKMVSKCVYIQILKATKSEILENFLDKKGWDLLNSWMSEAVLTENWAQCKELIKLFLECPVRAGAIEENEALKLVKQLSCDIGVQEQVKELALQVQKKWMSILNPPEDPEDLISLPSQQNECTETAGADVDLKSKKDSVDDRRKTEESLPVVAEEQPKSSKKVNGHKRKNNDDDDKGSRISSKKDSERGKRNDKTKFKEHVCEKPKETKEKHRSEKKSKPYSRTELKDDLGDLERSRIKEKAQKMKDDLASKRDSSKENSSLKNSSTSGLEKMQKISKKANREKVETSFNDMLGVLDASKAKKTVKVAPSKNKNKGLMESLSSTNASKPPSSKQKQVKPISSQYSQSNSSRGTKASTSTSAASKNKSAKHENGISISSLMIAPELKSDKRPIEKSKVGLKECDIFGNVLSTAMHDDIALNEYYPRKKKLKLSGVKTDKVAPETPIIEPELEKKIDSFSFYGGGEVQSSDTKIENENDTGNNVNMTDEKDFSSNQVSESDTIQSTASISKEVSGILVISRGPKSAKREVHWKSDEDLVQIEYFELDETERINVNKVKFDTMRQREAAMEKEKFGTLTNKVAIEDEENASNRIPWKLVELDLESAAQKYGSDSQEKVTQAQRELGVLQAITFNMKSPPEPSEPDFCVIPETDPTIVPWEDGDDYSEVFDYSVTGWYPGVTSRPHSPQYSGINSTRRPETSQSALETQGLPINSVDNALSTVQYFGQKGEPLAPVNDNRTSHKSFYMDPNIQPPQESNTGPVNFYGNGGPYIDPSIKPAQESNTGPVNFYGNGGPYIDPSIQLPQESNTGPVNFYGNGMGGPYIDPSIKPPQESSTGPVNFYGNGMGGTVNGFGPESVHNGFAVDGYDPSVNQVGQVENNRFHEEMDQSNGWNRGQVRGIGRGFSYRSGGHRGNNGRGGGRGFRNNQNKHKDGNAGGRGGKQINRGQKRDLRPCKFWVQRRQCKDGDRCKFKHI